MASGLVINLGVQEPRFLCNGDYVLLGSRNGDPDAVAELGGVPGLYWTTWQLFERIENGEISLDAVSFPIAERAFRDAVQQSRSPIQHVLLVATNSEPAAKTPNTETADDTYYAALILKKWFERKIGVTAAVEILELRENPHLYESADRQIQRSSEFARMFGSAASGGRGHDRIFVSVSPGLPMVNAAISRHALRLGRAGGEGRVSLFQIERAAESHLRRGEPSGTVSAVPYQYPLDDLLYELIRSSLDRCDFTAALDAAKKLALAAPESKERLVNAIEKIAALWRLDLETAGVRGDGAWGLVNRLWIASFLVDVWVRKENFTEAAWRTGDILAKLRDSGACAGLFWPQLAWIDAAGRVLLRDIPPSFLPYLDEQDKKLRFIKVDALGRRAVGAIRHAGPSDWKTFVEDVDGFKEPLSLRHALVHGFCDVNKEDFQDRVAEPLGVNAAEVGMKLRDLIECFAGQSRIQRPEIDDFSKQAKQIKALLP